MAYVCEGAGGVPLLLVHGYPETKRIWWRNIAALAAAGFEVIAPDFRGHGDSSLAPDGFYDPATHSMDMHALVHGVLGHERCVAAGGDVGGVVIQDLGLRFEGFVVRQCMFNTVPPALREDLVAQNELDEFLSKYGHRAVAEIDLGMPRWSDDPTHILGVLANYLYGLEHFPTYTEDGELVIGSRPIESHDRPGKKPIPSNFPVIKTGVVVEAIINSNAVLGCELDRD